MARHQMISAEVNTAVARLEIRLEEFEIGGQIVARDRRILSISVSAYLFRARLTTPYFERYMAGLRILRARMFSVRRR